MTTSKGSMTQGASRSARKFACASFTSVALIAATSMAAPSAALRLKARNLYAVGEKALAAGNVDAAERDFEQAYKTLPNAAVLLKIADCKTRLGDAHGAVDALQRYLVDAPNPASRTKAQAQIDELKSKPGVVSVTTTPAGATILVDGTDSGKVAPSDVELSPGEHVVSAQLAHHETVQQAMTVEFASRKSLELTLSELEAPVASPPGAAAASEPQPTEASVANGYHLTPAFWVAVGGTVVGAGVMTGFGVAALGKHSDYQKKPSRSLYDDGRRDALIADVALGVTAASAATALVLLFTSKRDTRGDDHALLVLPSFVPGGGGVTGNVRF